MKPLYSILGIALAAASMLGLASCSSDDPFSTASASDEPHILDPIFPTWTNGQLPVVANISRDANFKMTVTVTPSQHTEVVWYLDDVDVAHGTTVDLPLLAGTYRMKVTATTTEGRSTYREGLVKVTPLAADPWSVAVGFERIIVPGGSAVIYGDNLDRVAYLRIGDEIVSDLVYDASASSISYIVPAGVPQGVSRLVLSDGEAEYGANTVTVSSSPLITSGADRMTAGAVASMQGINLDKITAITLAGKELEIADRTATQIQVRVPALEDGDYTLTGTSHDGPVQFFINGAVVDEATVVVSSQQTLWSGHHYVSWELDDADPHKTFNLLGKDLFASIKPGSIMTIHYSVEPSAGYHQLRTVTAWWSDLPGTGTVEFGEDGALEVVLSREALALIAEQDGFLCVGHGYYVDLITLR